MFKEEVTNSVPVTVNGQPLESTSMVNRHGSPKHTAYSTLKIQIYKRSSSSKTIEYNTKMMRTCRICRDEKPMSPSRIKDRNWICSKCSNREQSKDTARYLAKKLSSVLRKQGKSAPFPSTDFARRVYKKYNGKSVLSGETNVKNLCIVQIDPDAEWTLENAVLVTSAEGYALSRTKKLNHRQTLLVNWCK